MDGLEIVDITADKSSIDFDEVRPSSRNSNFSKPSVNFGGGIELLMNTNRKNKDTSSNHNSEADLEDLKTLSAELDDASNFSNQPRSSFRKAQSSIFDNLGKYDEKDLDSKPISIKFADDDKSDTEDEAPPSLSFVKENSSPEATKTWDGYQKFSSVPVVGSEKDLSSRMSKEDLLREKFIYLRKLEALQQNKGVKLTKMYTMDSSLDEMKGEYEMIIAEKEKDNSIKFQGKMLMMFITGLEYLNNKFDPFDVKLDGWTEQVSENLNDYDEIFAELHEKYRSKAKMAPELKLLFQLGGSAIMLHMTNTMFKSAMPSMDDIMRQNPELMRQFTQAAATSMTDNSPGFGGFINSLLGGGGGSNNRSEPMPMPMGPPPPAVSTKQSHPGRAGGFSSMVPPQPQPTFAPATNPRSALSAALGDNSRSQFGGSNRPDLDTVRPQPSNNSSPPERSTRVQRNEMKGPSDISDILQGLKTKKINIQSNNNNEGSTISASDLNELNGEKVLKSKRRPKSEKNTMSLDI